MSEENKVLEYDEDDSLKFIREFLPEEMKNEFSDDEINYIVDLIYEFMKRRDSSTRMMKTLKLRSMKTSCWSTFLKMSVRIISETIPMSR